MTSTNAFNPEIVLSFYADWILWLREKKAELLKQAAKMAPAKPVAVPPAEAAPEAGGDFMGLAFGGQPAPEAAVPVSEPPAAPVTESSPDPEEPEGPAEDPDDLA